MAKGKDKEKDKVSIKKLNRQLVQQRLEEAFSDFKEVADKKKFEEGLRKAGKLINSGLSKKTFDKLRKAKENSSDNGTENVASSHTFISDLP